MVDGGADTQTALAHVLDADDGGAEGAGPSGAEAESQLHAQLQGDYLSPE
jgi:hypothetical protein